MDDKAVQILQDFIVNFVAAAHRARLQYLLSKSKRRDELIVQFHADYVFDTRYLHPTQFKDLDPERVF